MGQKALPAPNTDDQPVMWAYYTNGRRLYEVVDVNEDKKRVMLKNCSTEHILAMSFDSFKDDGMRRVEPALT